MSEHPEAGRDDRVPQGLRCDFCGKEVAQVRRIALDRDYERLQTRHTVRYACAPCSQEKERERLARAEAEERERLARAGA